MITGWAVDMPELHDLLNLPEGYEPMALVPMGYPTVPFSQPQRHPRGRGDALGPLGRAAREAFATE